MNRSRRFGLLLAGMMALTALDEIHAQDIPAPADRHLVVVELFQSQGCSSCPPAEANLNALAGRSDVLALSFAVTYWDDLGWKDTFASQAFTDRQWTYARRRGRGDVWTPQVFVDGRRDLVGTDAAQLTDAIAEALHAQGARPTLAWQGDTLHVAGGGHPNADVWLVRFDPRTQQVPIGAGENEGRVLPHRNIVRQLLRLGTWHGAAEDYVVPAASMAGLATAAFIQDGPGGAIIGASIQH
ncbi:DUF1223 domain-containing protein [Dyella sp.]|uniref:DUF1223 domain-containing protein n=1 Tax=Dyella sp. TaxID=1869338 RepID=UPI002ED46A76